MGGASCSFCHIPLAGGNKPKFCSRSSLFQGVSTKRQEPRTRGNSDIHKLLQHTSSGHHHMQLRCLPSTDLTEEVHQSRPGASPGCLLWPNACTINHQALLFCLLDASWTHSFLHCGGCDCSCLPPFSGFYHQTQLHCSNEDHSASTCDDYNVSLYRALKACVSRVLGAIRAYVLQLLHLYVLCPVPWRHPFFPFGRPDHWIRVHSHSPSIKGAFSPAHQFPNNHPVITNYLVC